MIIILGLESVLIEQETNNEKHPNARISFFIII